MPQSHFKHNRSWRHKNSKPESFLPSRSEKRKTSHSQRKQRMSFSVVRLIAWLFPYALIALALGILTIVAMFAWYSKDLPRPDKIIDRSVAQSTKIFDKTGEHLLFEVHGDQRRTIVPLEEIPDHVKWATIVIEDKNFYTHKGFYLKGIIRALVANITSLSKQQGASTLTQQLVKNALLTNEKSYARKIKESVLTYQIERKFSKDQILQLYFNEIPYGSSSYGAQSAAQFYFEKNVQDLSIAEGAILASLPKAPTYFSPYGSNIEELMSRKDTIINLMVEQGKLTQEQSDIAKIEKLTFSKSANNLRVAPHFVIMVREMLAREYGEREVEQGGLKVITTLDWEMQQKAEEAIEEFAERNKEQYNATNAAIVAIDPSNGHILAMVGSVDYFSKEIEGNFNVVTQGKRQPGSSFKPFVYAAGFELGYTDKTTLWDVITEFGEKANGEQYKPNNYDTKERGPISIRSALQGSVNIPAVKMLYLVGPRNVIKKAEKFGYTTFNNPERYGLSLVLGGAEVKLIEHTGAYATLANNGIKKPQVSILSVTNPKGKTLQEYKEVTGERAMDSKIVNIITDVLSDNNARAPFFGENNYLTIGTQPVAAKTGTTNDYRDAWMMGYTPTLATGVWVGNNDFSAMKRGAGGSTVAGPIWNKFMRTALEGTSITQFTKPDIVYPEKRVLRGDLEGGTPIKIDKFTGLLASEFTPKTSIEEKIFRAGHNILHYVDPANPLGPEPSEKNRDPFYAKWESAVQRWMLENDWKADQGEIPTEFDTIHRPEDKPEITINSPFEGETITGDFITFRVEAYAPRGISRVEFYVDDKLVAESRSEPFIGRYIPNPNTTNGFHKLQAIAYDDIDNSEQAEVNFNLLQSKTNISIDWNKPEHGSLFNEFDFPIQIELGLPGSDFQKIEIFAAPKSNPEQYSLIRTITTITPTVNTIWNTIPEIGGEYDLYTTVWDKNNTPTRVNGITIEIDVPNRE